ncbi:MAG: pyridoxamine 5'-phosphate oxidase family protein [Rhizobiales bacterium]|nr:pyridoxamine 5'-phosphate oxidase family protein [Hyphomicrobiales bacterium]
MGVIETEAGLREVLGRAEGLAVQKSRPGLDKYFRQFIAMSPFLVLSSANAKGKGDVSPRGDPPGFVHVVDDRTILIPDRPGNNRFDSMVNIIENPNVACLFMIPGFEDTLRLAGRARITHDADLLRHCAINGKEPKVGILVTVEEAFLHCSKALKRSKLWHDDYKQDRSQMPSLARIIIEQSCESQVDETVVAEADARVEEDSRTGLY